MYYNKGRRGCSKTVLQKEETETAENSRLGFFFLVR